MRVWADDLKPEPLGQEIQEYNGFWQSSEIDPGNHEVWRLYIYDKLIPKNNYNHEVELLLTGLTPNPKDHYYVMIRINQLYNSFRAGDLKRGDVIVVEGRVQNTLHSSISGPRKDIRLKNLYFYTENAEQRPQEHVDIAVPPTPTPTGTTQGSAPNSPSTSSPGTAMTASSTVVSQTAVTPVAATPGFYKADPGTPAH